MDLSGCSDKTAVDGQIMLKTSEKLQFLDDLVHPENGQNLYRFPFGWTNVNRFLNMPFVATPTTFCVRISDILIKISKIC